MENVMDYSKAIEEALKKYEELLRGQLERVERINSSKETTDFSKLDRIVIGICGGDGIGPVISAASRRVLGSLLADRIKDGKVELREIEGLTIENRAAAGKAIPDDVLAELKKWHKMSGLPLKKFFNTSGLLYKSMGLKDKLQDITEEEQLKLLATDGMLVKRPILVTDGKVLVGFREKEYEEALK